MTLHNWKSSRIITLHGYFQPRHDDGSGARYQPKSKTIMTFSKAPESGTDNNGELMGGSAPASAPIGQDIDGAPFATALNDRERCFTRLDWWAFWVAFAIAFSVYFYTLAPSVTMSDAGELAVAGDHLGVPHPPGYPLWTMTAFIFRTIFRAEFRGHPNPAWSMNLMSAMFGAVAAGIMAMLLSRSGRDILSWLSRRQHELSAKMLATISWTGAVAGSLIFSFSPAHWSQAVIVEVYTMNVFFLALLFLFIYLWILTPKPRWLYSAVLAFGLGLSNHHTLLLIAAAVVVVVLLKDHDLFRDFAVTGIPYLVVIGAVLQGWLPALSHPLDPSMYVYLFLNFLALLLACYLLPRGRTVAFSFLLIQLGLLVYLYMPIASDFNPPHNWGNTRTWEGFVHAITRGQYERITPTDVFSEQFLRQVGDFFADLRSQFTLPMALLGFLPFTAWHFRAGNRYIRMRWITIPISLVAVFLIVSEEMIASPGNTIPLLSLSYRLLSMLIMFMAALGVLLMVVAEGRDLFLILRNYKRSEYSWTNIAISALTLGGAAVVYLFIALKLLARAGGDTAASWSLRALMILIVPAIPLLTATAAWLISDRRIQADMDLNADSRKWMLTTMAGFLAIGIVLVILANPTGDLQDAFIQRVKWISSHALFTFWVAYGLMFALVLVNHTVNRLFPAATGRLMSFAACGLALLSPGLLLLNNAYNPELIRTIGGVEQRGHDFGWQFGNYQLRGAAAIMEELGEPDGPVVRVRGLPDFLVDQPLTPWHEPLPNPEYPPPMGTNAIFFGGTDPGRFVPTYMIFSARVRPDVYLITQNALADNTYMSVMRDLYGDDIFIPSAVDSSHAFHQYLDDVRSGRRPASAAIVTDGDRVSVQGVQGVMIINGILARMIFDMNKARHDFYVEESYVIEWMYPYLKPHGLIMKINDERLPQIPPQRVKDDMEFWDWYVRRLTSNPKFMRDIVARKSFSKLRSAIAGLYVYRNLMQEAEQAFLEAKTLYPLSPEANFRLADLYLRMGRPDDAIDLMEAFHEQDPGNERVLPFIRQVQQRQELNQKATELQQLLQSGQATFSDATNLAEIYHQLGNQQAFRSLTSNLLGDENVPPAVLRELSKSLRRKDAFDLVEQALSRYIQRVPADQEALLDLAEARVQLRNVEGALQILQRAIRISPGLREQLRHDQRFAPLRNHPHFRQILQMR